MVHTEVKDDFRGMLFVWLLPVSFIVFFILFFLFLKALGAF
jgi:hypothetical protein